MGLDMYLNKSTYVGANYKHNNVSGVIDIKKDGKPLPINFNRVSSIKESVGYWRKANQIHNWFVQNVQDGEDDCKEYYVSIKKLEQLVELCKKDIAYLNTLETKNSGEERDLFTQEKFTYKIFLNVNEEELNLPPQDGFFFGSTEINEYFLEQLQETIDMLQPLIDNESNGDFYYEASW